LRDSPCRPRQRSAGRSSSSMQARCSRCCPDPLFPLGAGAGVDAWAVCVTVCVASRSLVGREPLPSWFAVDRYCPAGHGVGDSLSRGGDRSRFRRVGSGRGGAKADPHDKGNQSDHPAAPISEVVRLVALVHSGGGAFGGCCSIRIGSNRSSLSVGRRRDGHASPSDPAAIRLWRPLVRIIRALLRRH
jgi:hypothetical protein